MSGGFRFFIDSELADPNFLSVIDTQTAFADCGGSSSAVQLARRFCSNVVDLPDRLFSCSGEGQIIRKLILNLQCALQYCLFEHQQLQYRVDGVEHSRQTLKEEKAELFQEVLELRDSTAALCYRDMSNRRGARLDGNYKCHQCGNKYPYAEALQSHISKRHQPHQPVMRSVKSFSAAPFVDHEEQFENSAVLRSEVLQMKRTMDDLLISVKVSQKEFSRESLVDNLFKGQQTRLDHLERVMEQNSRQPQLLVAPVVSPTKRDGPTIQQRPFKEPLTVVDISRPLPRLILPEPSSLLQAPPPAATASTRTIDAAPVVGTIDAAPVVVVVATPPPSTAPRIPKPIGTIVAKVPTGNLESSDSSIQSPPCLLPIPKLSSPAPVAVEVVDRSSSSSATTSSSEKTSSDTTSGKGAVPAVFNVPLANPPIVTAPVLPTEEQPVSVADPVVPDASKRKAPKRGFFAFLRGS